jgi:hypothetical protein
MDTINTYMVLYNLQSMARRRLSMFVYVEETEVEIDLHTLRERPRYFG